MKKLIKIFILAGTVFLIEKCGENIADRAAEQISVEAAIQKGYEQKMQQITGVLEQSESPDGEVTQAKMKKMQEQIRRNEIEFRNINQP